MQLKVMLVDDEPFILRGLTMLIDWEKEGCEIVKTASNGKDAYEYYKENPVDLIIADIKMPVMTGLELLEKIRQEDTNTFFVIQSGYNDFAYAQKALRFGSMDYILKPVQKDTLLELVRKVVSQKEATAREEEDNLKLQRSYLVQNLSTLIKGKADAAVLEYVKEQLPCSEKVRYIQIWLNAFDYLEEMDDNELWELKKRLYENCTAFLGEESSYCLKDVFGYDEEHNISVIYCEAMAEKRQLSMQEFMEKLLQEAGRDLGVPVVLLIGKEVDDIAKVSHSYSSACVLKSFKGFRAEKSLYYYEEEVHVNQNKVVLCKQSLDKLISAVEQNDRVEINNSVDALFTEMESIGMTGEIVSMNTNYLLFQLIHLAVEQDESVDQEEVMLYISNNVFDADISRGSRAHLRRFACEYAEYLIQLRKNVSRGVLMEVEHEVREHFAENLTLKELSKKYFVNSSYLGQIFRKKYGQSFKDYLSNYRINEAAQMLLRTDKKISVIAEEVGYHDTDYFISRFIEQKGCTPARYRKNAGEIDKNE
ncbi:MAG: response regulator [Lachnospiraceae bacterium]|nr:response regulator [Lachnospiraceae bacterium]